MTKRKLSRFSQKEILHLAISVGIMSILIAYAWGLLSPFGILIALVVIAPAFVFHEMGHKFAAQHYGFPAEYRMWVQGLLFAILITLITRGAVIFIAPGAVYFSARGMLTESGGKVGRIGLAGPLINLALVVIFGMFAFLSPNETLRLIGGVGAYVNAFLAIFNLIPFPPLDGQKVFSWDKKVWLSAMGLAVASFILVSF